MEETVKVEVEVAVLDPVSGLQMTADQNQPYLPDCSWRMVCSLRNLRAGEGPGIWDRLKEP